MSAPKLKPACEPVAVDLNTAAALLDLSEDTFRSHVLPHLAVITITERCRRVSVAELRRWALENGAEP